MLRLRLVTSQDPDPSAFTLGQLELRSQIAVPVRRSRRPHLWCDQHGRHDAAETPRRQASEDTSHFPDGGTGLVPLLCDVVREATRRVRRLRRRRASSLALVRAGGNAAVRVMKLGPQSTPDDVQRVRHGGVSTQRRPLAADGLGGGRRPPLVAGQPHVTLRIKKIAERRTIWGAAAPRGPNSRRRAAAAKRIFQGAQEGKVAASRRVFGAFVRVPRIDRPRFLPQRNAAKSDRPRLQTHRSRSERS